MVVFIKMANDKFPLGSNIRFAFQLRTSTFVTSPSFVSVFSWTMEWINESFFISNKVYTGSSLNTCERFKDNFCKQNEKISFESQNCQLKDVKCIRYIYAMQDQYSISVNRVEAIGNGWHRGVVYKQNCSQKQATFIADKWGQLTADYSFILAL